MELSPETVRLAAFITGLGLFYVVESLLAHRPWHSPRGRRLALHAGLAILNSVILRLAVAGPLLYLAQYVTEREIGIVPWIGVVGWSEVVATVIVLDMADYWWHRLNHRIPFLWRFHQVHHVDTHVDVTTSLRFHFGELLLSGIAKAIWIVVWGPSLWGFALFELSVSLASQYHHSNIDYPDWLEPAVRAVNVTPRMHASHHSALTHTLNANFSTVLSVWDRMFGTFARPTDADLRVMGLRYGRERDLELGYLLALPFRTPPDAWESTRRSVDDVPGGAPRG
ncbi:MAG: sterol desaturase family protein [Acidobacteriota bacterium]|nr:sterol desaturase family protein [Acidobacteriota bacterium]